uniref:D-ribitol-5-phosphate cytidylyltransferase n=1 Tax=Apteryx owenii TaxID=8824 RepID=A0A8B9SAM5_APTOW
ALCPPPGGAAPSRSGAAFGAGPCKPSGSRREGSCDCLRISWISDIIVVVSPENIETMKTIIQKYGHKRVTVVKGGITRHRSIFNGLKVFAENEFSKYLLQKPEVVVIHDAVRPFVEEDILLEVVMAAKEHGCTDYDLDYGTECLHLAVKYCKIKAKLIEGTADLWKVKVVLISIFYILSQQICVITDVKEDAVQVGLLLHESLKSQIKVSTALVVNFMINLIFLVVTTRKKWSNGVVFFFIFVPLQVHLNSSENISFSFGMEELTRIKKFAREVKEKNIWVYGLLIHYKVCNSSFFLQVIYFCDLYD